MKKAFDRPDGRYEKNDVCDRLGLKMSMGWLIFLNIATIPFLVQAEEEGVAQEKFPSLFKIILLDRVRRQRWFFGYLILAFVFFLLAVTPTSSGKSHVVSTEMVVAVFSIQALLWGFVFLKIKSRKNKDTTTYTCRNRRAP